LTVTQHEHHDHSTKTGRTKRMQATARRLSVVSATSCARRRLIRDVQRRTPRYWLWGDAYHWFGRPLTNAENRDHNHTDIGHFSLTACFCLGLCLLSFVQRVSTASQDQTATPHAMTHTRQNAEQEHRSQPAMASEFFREISSVNTAIAGGWV
jgi:hypothetical protein